jgi:hypothetical protein
MGTFQQIKTDITHVGNIGRYGSLLHMRGKYFDDPFCSNEGFKGNDGCFALPPLPVEVHAMAKFLRTVAAFLASPTSLVGIVIKSSREALAFHCGICRCHAQPNICGLESNVVTYKT